VVLDADVVETRKLSEVAVVVVRLTVLSVMVLAVVLVIERDVLVLVAIPLHTKL
jgi:hypothetical protein